MNKNKQLLYTILGSVILIFLALERPYNLVYNSPMFGFELSQILLYISNIGVILTVVFSVMLIHNNLKDYFKEHSKRYKIGLIVFGITTVIFYLLGMVWLSYP